MDPITRSSRELHPGDELRCPTCEHVRRVYRRPISFALATDLADLAAHTIECPHDWHHVNVFLRKGRASEFTRWKYWGFIIEAINTDTKKKRSGLWALTAPAYGWLRGRSRIPSAKVCLEDTVLYDLPELIRVSDRLESFDYEKLMQGEMQRWQQ